VGRRKRDATGRLSIEGRKLSFGGLEFRSDSTAMVPTCCTQGGEGMIPALLPVGARTRGPGPSRARRTERLGLAEQSWTGAAVAAVIAPVTPVVPPIIAAVTAVVTPVIATIVTTTDQAGAIPSISQQTHGHTPFMAAWRSASTAAMSAWVGIRPLATNCPPDRRTAEPNGAALVFSHISTAAALPGSSDSPISATSSSASRTARSLSRAHTPRPHCRRRRATRSPQPSRPRPS
jgi:hypothetical protein